MDPHLIQTCLHTTPIVHHLDNVDTEIDLCILLVLADLKCLDRLKSMNVILNVCKVHEDIGIGDGGRDGARAVRGSICQVASGVLVQQSPQSHSMRCVGDVVCDMGRRMIDGNARGIDEVRQPDSNLTLRSQEYPTATPTGVVPQDDFRWMGRERPLGGRRVARS